MGFERSARVSAVGRLSQLAGLRFVGLNRSRFIPANFRFGLTLPDVMTNDTHRCSARDAAASVGFGRSDRSGGLGPATVEYAR